MKLCVDYQTLAVVVCIASVGCGGVSKNDMLERARARTAMNRKADEAAGEQGEKPAAESAPAATPASATADKPAAAPPANAEKANAHPAKAAAASPVAAAPAVAPLPESVYTPPSDASQAVYESAANLKKLAQAILKVVEETERLPSATVGKGLSWRVTLLPYLGHNDLYAKFKLDEPWDSPHNKALLAEMPPVYRVPGLSGAKTAYYLVTGRPTLFSRPEVRRYYKDVGLRDRTVMMIEGDPAEPVYWTQPGDWEVQQRKETEGLERLRGGTPIVAWADGKVTLLKTKGSKDLIGSAFRYAEQGDTRLLRRTSYGLPVPRPQQQTAAAASPSAPGGGSPVAAGGASTTAAAEPTSELADSYLRAATAAYAQGDRLDAWNWLRGAIAAGLPAAQWRQDFQWTPGVRRPTMGLQLGVAALLESPVDMPESPSLVDEQDDLRAEIVQLAEPFGEPLLRLLDEHAEARLPATFGEPSGPRRRGAQRQTPLALTCLPLSTTLRSLFDQANRAGCDVLVVLSIDTSASRRRRSLRAAVYDPRRGGDPLFTTAKATVTTALRQDPAALQRATQTAQWSLKDFLQDSLRAGEWPVRLTPALAKRRIGQLSASGPEHPLPILVEMQYYATLGLVDGVDLLRATNQLIGAQAGPSLVLGSPLRKRRVLREWLPSDDPAAVVAMAEQRRRARDDEDD